MQMSGCVCTQLTGFVVCPRLISLRSFILVKRSIFLLFVLCFFIIFKQDLFAKWNISICNTDITETSAVI